MKIKIIERKIIGSLNICLVLGFLLLSFINLKATPLFLKQKEEPVKDSLTKFQKFNIKAERLFKILPVPVSSYSSETGAVLGLAKYNLVTLIKSDTISTAAKFNELVSVSSEGQYKLTFGNNLYFHSNKYHLIGEANFIKFPEYFSGIGNDSKDKILEEVEIEKLSFNNSILIGCNKKNTLYAGVHQKYSNYLSVEKIYRSLSEQSNVLRQIEYPGHEGGVVSGLGGGVVYDDRDNRYNASNGNFLSASYLLYDKFLGSKYALSSLELDFRRYFNPFKDQVLAMQFYVKSNFGTVPFYSLAMMGGGNRMRGYYLGRIRDKVEADFQLEYRAHVWSVFGLTAFCSAGRVASDISSLSTDNLWYAGGFGLRIMVDKENKANLRIDFGYGENSHALIIGFTEAF
ncbi:MAG: hypothetical protein COB15_17085 [Flavobacteriales bacterium]|nr:MAG: hypothetical protein COB15_17085 [Flavobacteriales bacterium]